MIKDLLQSILPLFKEQLAKLFDKLRLGSPIAYLITMGVILGGAEAIRSNPEIISTLPDWASYVVIIIEVSAAVILSSRTKRHMPKAMEEHSEIQLKVLSTDEVKKLRDWDD